MIEPRAQREVMNWLLEPPLAREVRILVAVGDRAALSPELRETLEQLASVLQEHEVQGYSAGRYFVPFPAGAGEVRGHDARDDAINFGFRAIS